MSKKTRLNLIAGSLVSSLALTLLINGSVFANTMPVTPPVTMPITPPVSPTPTVMPTATASATPSATPTATATPTVTPTVSPTPTATPIVNHPPVVATTSLPNAKVGIYYKALIRVYDLDKNDTVIINSYGLPNWLNNVNCVVSYTLNKKIYSCTYSGMPNKTGIYTIRVNAKDNKGAIVNKYLKLVVN